MKRGNLSSSAVLLSFLALSGSAWLLAGCNPLVVTGNDATGTDGSGANGKGSGSGNGSGSGYTNGNEVKADGAVDCHIGLVPSGGGWGGPALSNDDLTAATQLTEAGAQASASHIKGKWYFEVHVDAMPDGTWWAQNIGAGVAEVAGNPGEMAHMGSSYNREGSISSNIDEFGFSYGDKYGTGDTVGVATDLDNGRIYFRKNGAWQNGDPEAGTDGSPVLTVPGMGSFYPFLSISEGDQMTANFGETAFADATPAGYAAFADGLVADANGNCADPGPAGVPADPAPVNASCNGFTSYDSSEAGAAEMHVVSVYEAESGTINVHVDRTMPMVLVLASYDPVEWNVTLAAGAQVQKIVMSSYEKSDVSAPGGIPVEKHIFEVSSDWFESGDAWPNSTGGSDTPKLVDNAEAATGLPLTSFSGCYSGGTFTITN